MDRRNRRNVVSRRSVVESIANICKPFKPRSYLPVAPATCHLFSTYPTWTPKTQQLTQHLARPTLGATADLEGCVHEVLYQHLPTVLQALHASNA